MIHLIFHTGQMKIFSALLVIMMAIHQGTPDPLSTRSDVTNLSGSSGYTYVSWSTVSTVSANASTDAEQLECYTCIGNENKCGKRSTSDRTLTCPMSNFCVIYVELYNGRTKYARGCAAYDCSAAEQTLKCKKDVCFKCCATSLCNHDELSSASSFWQIASMMEILFSVFFLWYIALYTNT